jgi:hypothetical protein
MSKSQDPMQKFDFLIGKWDMVYRVPVSTFSPEDQGVGNGTFKRALNDRYVYFDYKATFGSGSAAAHAVFAWDPNYKIYRYWWFEDSGSFQTASCNFINEDILHLNWHDTLLVQTFKQIASDQIILKMESPVDQSKFEIILEVIFTRT